MQVPFDILEMQPQLRRLTKIRCLGIQPSGGFLTNQSSNVPQTIRFHFDHKRFWMHLGYPILGNLYLGSTCRKAWGREGGLAKQEGQTGATRRTSDARTAYDSRSNKPNQIYVTDVGGWFFGQPQILGYSWIFK